MGGLVGSTDKRKKVRILMLASKCRPNRDVSCLFGLTIHLSVHQNVLFSGPKKKGVSSTRPWLRLVDGGPHKPISLTDFGERFEIRQA